MPDLPWTPELQYPIYGKIPNYPNETVTATNLTTLETQTVISENDTSYVMECANFSTSGYTNYDVIQISVAGRNEIISINMLNSEFIEKRKLDINPPLYNSNRITQYY